MLCITLDNKVVKIYQNSSALISNSCGSDRAVSAFLPHENIIHERSLDPREPEFTSRSLPLHKPTCCIQIAEHLTCCFLFEALQKVTVTHCTNW